MAATSGSIKTRFADTWSSVLFDLVRGLAAVVVFLGHWRNLFFVDFPQVAAHRAAVAVFYLLTSAGHQAVVLFFVLSGYFVGGTVLRDLQRGTWSWRAYLLRRMVRLWLVLAPALLLCLLWDSLGLSLHRAPLLYGGQVSNHIVPNVSTLLGPHIFFGNLFFLQAFRVPTYGSDGPLWSLAYEFWYYLMFPLAAVVVWKSSSLAHRLGAAALFVGIMWFVWGGIAWSFPIWLMGVLLYKLPELRIRAKHVGWVRVLAVAAYLPFFYAAAKQTWIPGFTADCILAVLSFLLLWVLRSGVGPHRNTACASCCRASWPGVPTPCMRCTCPPWFCWPPWR